MSSAPINFTIRRARITDGNRIRAMQALSCRARAPQSHLQAEVEGFMTFAGAADDHLIAEGNYSVIEAGSELVAAVGWSKARTNGDGDPTAGPRVAKVSSFFVHPDWTHHGFGSRLLQHVEAEVFAAGFDEMALNAMLPDVEFYAAMGYHRVRDIALSLHGNVVYRGMTMRKALTVAVATVPPATCTVAYCLTDRRCDVAA